MKKRKSVETMRSISSNITLYRWRSKLCRLPREVLILLYLLPHGCQIKDCEPPWDSSPSELIEENEYIVTGTFASMDTIQHLGTINFESGQSSVTLIEYVFYIERVIKGDSRFSKLFLWNCETTEVDSASHYSTISDFKPGDTLLVAGKGIRDYNYIIYTMLPNFFMPRGNIDSLDFRGPGFFEDADTIIISQLTKSHYLDNILRERAKRGQVIYCPQAFMLTISDYYEGGLCYYDSSGIARSVTSREYLAELLRVE